MASSRNVSLDELESLLECPICMERINDPRSLPCFHNFCKMCLNKYVEGLRCGKNVEMFPCPTCRSEFSLKSNENVEGMAGNYFIRNMLEVMTLQQKAKVCSLYIYVQWLCYNTYALIICLHHPPGAGQHTEIWRRLLTRGLGYWQFCLTRGGSNLTNWFSVHVFFVPCKKLLTFSAVF